MNVSEFFSYARKKLSNISEREVDFEVKILLEKYLNFNDIDFILNKHKPINDLDMNNLKKAIDLRLNGMPIQYIIGNWDFMDISLKVGEGVLIPREDTRVLVDMLSSKLKKTSHKIIDICSGSGCIALSIEKLHPNTLDIYALEKSPIAYEYLLENIRNLNSTVKAINKDLLTAHKCFDDNFFDFIVSNPPYIKTSDLKHLQTEVLHEPQMALDGGENGLIFYENICKLWTPKLKSGGTILFEIGKGQFEEVREIMIMSGIKNIEFKRDINGIIRCISGTR